MNQRLSEKEYLKAKELAEVLNVSTECIRSWIHQGRIPVKRFGRAVRIPMEVAEKILREGLNDATRQ